jgi:choline dehydrogenase-like flavoprotein
MIIDGKKLIKSKSFEADLCIMGCGVAGTVLANELNNIFPNIVIIESGDEWYSQEAQDLYAASKPPKYYPDPIHSRLRFLGGASNHWGNNTSPLSSIDFEKRDWIPNSGWPISLKDVSPYYPKAAKYCGTGEDGYETQHWLKHFKQNNLVSSSANVEIGIAKASIPPVRFFAEHGEVIKSSKKITLIKNSNIVDIQFNSQSKKIDKVTFQSYNDISHFVEAKQYVMCFGGIENARMLAYFNLKNKNSLGNQNDNVGRYFMDHNTVRAAHLYTKNRELFELFEGQFIDTRRVLSFFQLSEKALKENQTTNLRIPLVNATEYELSDGISSFHILSQSAQEEKLPDNMWSHLSNVLMDSDMVIEAISRKKFDKRLFDHANEFSGYRSPLMIEQTPNRHNRIKLSNGNDRYGIPKIEINWRLTDLDKKLVWRGLELFAKEAGAQSLGRIRLLKERESRIFGDQMGFGSHHMGTTRMADDAEFGVVDKDLKVFGTENLFVAGCSVFPTGGHVPPTMTIVALTIRLAKYLKESNGYF